MFDLSTLIPSSRDLPLPLVLPALSLVLIALAGVVALFAWLTGQTRQSGRVTSWDVAAALTFIGCAAAIMGEAEHVIEHFWPHDAQQNPRTEPANG